MQQYNLIPKSIHGCTTFNNHAVVVEISKVDKYLLSFGFKICEINGINARILKSSISDTEELHIREFLRQNNFQVGVSRPNLLKKYS